MCADRHANNPEGCYGLSLQLACESHGSCESCCHGLQYRAAGWSVSCVTLVLVGALQVKPISKSSSGGCQTINVETYGGGLWYTWFDRDLGLAGRVLVREGSKLQHKLVKVDKPVLRIPMLAIHLQRNLYQEGFKPNFQDHLKPVLATIPKVVPLDWHSSTTSRLFVAAVNACEVPVHRPRGLMLTGHQAMLWLVGAWNPESRSSCRPASKVVLRFVCRCVPRQW